MNNRACVIAAVASVITVILLGYYLLTQQRQFAQPLLQTRIIQASDPIDGKCHIPSRYSGTGRCETVDPIGGKCYFPMEPGPCPK